MGSTLRASAIIGVVLCALHPAGARAETLLPLVTEEAQTLPYGVAEAVLGIAYFKDMRFPPFTPRGALKSQTLIGLPQLGFRIAAGSWAEIQGTYETLYLDQETAQGDSDRELGSGDARLATKFWLLREKDLFPALGVRFLTKLPNAARASHLGTDDTDFGAEGLFSKELGPVAGHVNLGILLLGNSGTPYDESIGAGGQDDLFSYSLAVVSTRLGDVQPEATTIRFLGEVAGLAGSRFGNDRASLRAGLQLRRGAGTVYLGMSAGLVDGSEDFGAGGGFVYTFEPARLFGIGEEDGDQ